MDQLQQSLTSLIGDMPAVRVILGFILVFLLPGFAWSLVFFTKNINALERLALSFGMSIALVTLAVLVLNILFHIRINGFNALVIIIAIIAAAFAIFFVKRYAMRRSGATGGE